MSTLCSLSFPARKLFESGGRSYGNALSAETMPRPCGLRPRTAKSLAAYPATMPRPNMIVRYSSTLLSIHPSFPAPFYETVAAPESSFPVSLRAGFAVHRSESRTEGGRRQASEGDSPEWPVDDAVRSRVLVVSPACGDSGNGKIVHQEQPGESTHRIESSPGRSGRH